MRLRHCSRMTSIADLASIVTSGATCVALVFAGIQLQQTRASDRRRRRVEIDGVAVSWRPIRVPRDPQDAKGRARWVYEFTAHNPGQLPVSGVQIEIHFALDVERLHYDDRVDKPTRELILETPVLAGGKEQTWRRKLLMNYADSQAVLPKTTAVISFIDPEDPGKRHVNKWPKRYPTSNRQL